MSIRDCVVLAVDGTHASGKSTLIHALAAHYRRQGVNVAAMDEPARSSPFMEEVVIHNRPGGFDIAAEVDVFAAHLQAQLRPARNHQLLIADKTIVNVLAYARMLVDVVPGGTDAAVLDAMETLCRAWVHTYDIVFFTHDRYSQPNDRFRAKVDGLQAAADNALRALYADLGVNVQEVPPGLETDKRVEWVVRRVAEMHVLEAG